MPELPEVETIRRSLGAAVVGQRVMTAEFRREDILRSDPRTSAGSAARCAARTPGSRIRDLGRVGKHLVVHLDDDWGWIVHLGMSGTLTLSDGGPEADHTHVVWTTEDGSSLRFRDPRRFGGWTAAEIPPPEGVLKGRVGIDALDPELDAAAFAARLAESRSPVKCRLLDQRLVAGLGNIYVDEALYEAGIHPGTPACHLSSASWERLYWAVRRILASAIDHRGTTFSDFRDGRGLTGDNWERLRVYGRAGAACGRCGRQVEKMILRGRGTHYCPGCQGEEIEGGETGDDSFPGTT